MCGTVTGSSRGRFNLCGSEDGAAPAMAAQAASVRSFLCLMSRVESLSKEQLKSLENLKSKSRF